MGWDGNGTFTRSNGQFVGSGLWQQDEANSIDIESVRHDVHDQDFAAGLNNCLTKDGQNTMAADLDLGSNDIVNGNIDWGLVSNKPATFAPSAHTHVIADLTDSKFPAGFGVSDTGNVITDFRSTDDNAVQVRLRSDQANRRVIGADQSGAVEAQILLENERVRMAGNDSLSPFATFTDTGIATIGGSFTTRPTLNGTDIATVDQLTASISAKSFSATNTAGTQVISSSQAAVLNWNTPDLTDAAFTFNATTGILTVNLAGNYEINGHVGVVNGSGTRYVVLRVQKNGADIGITKTVQPASATDSDYIENSYIIDAAIGDTFQLTVNSAGAATPNPLVVDATLTVKALTS